jgi:TPP-dependent pyruvate/acetoin dehydrogenase alpha subunit
VFISKIYGPSPFLQLEAASSVALLTSKTSIPSTKLPGILNEGLDEDEFKKIDKNIKEIVSDAADFALESSEPDLADLYEDIYLDD